MSWYQHEDIELANYYVDQPFLIGNNESRNFNIVTGCELLSGIVFVKVNHTIMLILQTHSYMIN